MRTFLEFDSWIRTMVLPLWAAHCIPRLGSWEALDPFGVPQVDMVKRTRVQFRQTYVFASAHYHHMDPSGLYLRCARDAFRFAMRCGFVADQGQFCSRVSPSGEPLDECQSLYDLAFMLLALSALLRAGESELVDVGLHLWRKAFNRHFDRMGWLETPFGGHPRRQNPHMHLFEAATSFYEASRDKAFLEIARKCLGLYKDYFLDKKSGFVFEFFEADWSSFNPGQQVVEPGHMMEWIYLISYFERVVGEKAGVDLRLLFDTACGIGLDQEEVFLIDLCSADGVQISTDKRLWPQLEFLKAIIELAARGEPLSAQFCPTRVLQSVSSHYFGTPKIGGWYDKLNADNQVVSELSPASSLYHVFSSYLCWKHFNGLALIA